MRLEVKRSWWRRWEPWGRDRSIPGGWAFRWCDKYGNNMWLDRNLFEAVIANRITPQEGAAISQERRRLATPWWKRAIISIWVLLSGCGAIVVQIPEKCFTMAVPLAASASDSSETYSSRQIRVLPTALIQNFDKLRELHVTRGTLTLPMRLSALSVAAVLPSTTSGWILTYTGIPTSAFILTASRVNLINYVDSTGLISFQFAFSSKDVLLAQPWSMKTFVCLAGEASP